VVLLLVSIILFTYALCIVVTCKSHSKLNVQSSYMQRSSRFEFPIPNRYRHNPDWIVPFPTSRISDFVFPTGVPVPEYKIWKQKWLKCFPDRSRPLSSLAPRFAIEEELVDDLVVLVVLLKARRRVPHGPPSLVLSAMVASWWHILEPTSCKGSCRGASATTPVRPVG
jgi:hypothetical protein